MGKPTDLTVPLRVLRECGDQLTGVITTNCLCLLRTPSSKLSKQHSLALNTRRADPRRINHSGKFFTERSHPKSKSFAANLQRDFYVLVCRRKNCHESDNCVSYANRGLVAWLQCAAKSRRVVGCVPRTIPATCTFE